MPDVVHAESWREFMQALGRAIFDRRDELGMSQEALAYAAGLSRASVQRIERGKARPDESANPSLHSILAIAQVLELSVVELLPPVPDLTNLARS